jgi:long-chain acyl-CoA synthetase
MTLQIIDRLRTHAQHKPRAEALRELDGTGRSLTYDQLWADVIALAGRIAQQCPDRPVVLISFPNQLEFATAFLAVLSAGGAAFPLHPRLTDDERRTAARRSGAAGILGTDEAIAAITPLGLVHLSVPAPHMRAAYRGPLADSPPGWVDRSDVARLLLQSSGTTGAPKIVERSGVSLDAVARNVAASVPLRPDDHVLGLVPACHSYGVENVLLGPLWAGCTVQLCQSLDALLVRGDVCAPPPTVFPGVPSMFEMLAAAGDPTRTVPPALRRLRRVYSAGATLPRSVFGAFQKRFGLRVGQLYGMTEIGSVTFNDPDEPDHDPDHVGLPMDGVRIRVVDPETKCIDRPLPPDAEGEVAVSAPSMLTGYLGDDQPVCEAADAMRDGFFLTADLGRLDGCGRLTITGRLKLVVDVGGLKVNLLEVEQALSEHEAVEQCAVIPVAVSATVSRLKAYIIPRNGHGDLSFEELHAFLRPRLSAHKIPRSFECRDSFPRSPTGKLLRYRL